MPHVTVKMFPGRTEDQKNALAARIDQAVQETLGSTASSVSVAIEDVAKDDWMATVYEPEIAGKAAALYKKPGYGPLASSQGETS